MGWSTHWLDLGAGGGTPRSGFPPLRFIQALKALWGFRCPLWHFGSWSRVQEDLDEVATIAKKFLHDSLSAFELATNHHHDSVVYFEVTTRVIGDFSGGRRAALWG